MLYAGIAYDTFASTSTEASEMEALDSSIHIPVSLVLYGTLSGVRDWWTVQRLATAGDEATADAYDEFAEEAAATLSTSLALMRAVISTNTAVQTAADAVDQGAVYRRAVEPPAEQLEVGASMEARWAALDACHHAVLPYVRHAVDSWQRKATAARGGTGAGTLHALGQSVSLQVSTAMRNAPRQVARTQLQRHAAPARLCEELVHHQPVRTHLTPTLMRKARQCFLCMRRSVVDGVARPRPPSSSSY